ncbi:MAG: hypothetical protein A2W31_13705 [Planctomycetes bacterium RBG_16_64_10]|nr:MAG: hypothetical protein A2W31_13705 [Planctomycetes bacterium RBG_16_64_10]
MRNVVWAALLGAAVTVLAGAWDRPTAAALGSAAGPNPGSDGSLISLLAAADEQGQLLILIDPRTRAMGVYHIERATGEVALKCVRNFSWDLQMLEFNGKGLQPKDIRGMLEGK